MYRPDRNDIIQHMGGLPKDGGNLTTQTTMKDCVEERKQVPIRQVGGWE